ncbi:hypothetical protein STTU_2176 [Streptomyces sp. Tu6071]|nr:hypothetical protein STTU_2176 [Streptomyces sp. Tu6071]
MNDPSLRAQHGEGRGASGPTGAGLWGCGAPPGPPGPAPCSGGLPRRPPATAFREDPRGDDRVLAEAARMMALSLTTPPRAEDTSEEPST